MSTAREQLRGEWGRYLLGMVLAAAVAYFTTTSAIQIEIAQVKATQSAQFDEVLRRLNDMKEDLRELRGRQR
jgi:cell division protein FtsB